MKDVIKLMLLAVLSCLGMRAQADNVVSISTVQGNAGDEVTVSVSMNNTDVVSSLQLSVPVDDKVLCVVDGSGKAGSRCTGHQVTVGYKDGALNIFVYSLSMAAINGNSGEVASFKVKLGSQPGYYAMEQPKVTLTGTTGAEVASTSIVDGVDIRGAYLFAYQEEIDFSKVSIGEEFGKGLGIENHGNEDLVITGLKFSDVTAFSSDTEFPLVVEPGYSSVLNVKCIPQKRGEFTETMTIQCNSPATRNSIRLKGEAFVANVLTVEPTSGASDEVVTIRLTMKNNDAVSGYQVEFDMPPSLQFVDGSFTLSDRKEDHQAAVTMDGNHLRILVYSPQDKPFKGKEGEIGSFKVKLDGRESAMLEPTKAILSATINNVVENVLSNAIGGYINIVCPYIYGYEEMWFGNVPVTQECVTSYYVSNQGQAPLNISRVTFTDANLSLDDELPIVIPPSEGTYLLVRYNSIEEKSFDGAIMQIHSNDPDMRMKEIKVYGCRYAPNFLTAQVDGICPTDDLNIEISLDNYDALNGIQFDMTYPGNLYQLKDYTLGDRMKGMTVSMEQIDANTLRVLVYSMTEGGLASGKSLFMNIQMKPVKDEVPKGAYPIVFKNIILGTENMVNKYAGKYIGAETLERILQVSDFIPGDADGDTKVDVADIVDMINEILGLPFEIFVFKNADMNGDGVVDIFDVTLAINVILENSKNSSTTRELAEVQSRRSMEILESARLTTKDNGISLDIDQAERFTAFQFEVAVPEGTEIVDVRLGEGNHHQVRLVKTAENRYMVIGVSMSNERLQNTNDGLMALDFTQAGSGKVTISNVLFVTPTGEKSYFEGVSEGVLTGIETFETETDKAVIYDLSGRRMDKPCNQLSKGLYIVNGKKVLIK